MKARLVRCHICENWHSNPNHCSNCGAWSFRVNGKRLTINEKGIELVRGFPLPLERMITLDYSERES